MDSFKGSDKDKEAAAKPPAPKPRGTGNLSMDSFKSGGTGSLSGGLNATRRLGTGSIDVDRTIGAMTAEVENGGIIVGKLEGRMAVMTRAMRIIEKPAEVNQICAGISAGEANFTKQVAKELSTDQAVMRRVQVALYQFEQARKGLMQATEALEKAGLYQGAAKAQFVDQQCHVEKLRGQLYPLINLHVVFKDNRVLSQLIPTPKAVAAEDLLPPLPPPPPAAEAKPEPSLLGSSALANDPAVREVVDAFHRVTGNLKKSFTGLLGLKSDDKK
jgi:hypothetical protein